MARTEYFGAPIDPYRSIAEQTGLELRTVLGLARADRMHLRFDACGVLRRFDNSPATTRRRLRNLKRHWIRQGTDEPDRRPACPYCGDVYDADRRCTCTRPRRKSEPPPGYGGYTLD